MVKKIKLKELLPGNFFYFHETDCLKEVVLYMVMKDERTLSDYISAVDLRSGNQAHFQENQEVFLYKENNIPATGYIKL